MSNEKTRKQFHENIGDKEFTFEGLDDGYRFTIKGDREKIRQQRRVGASFINFARQADKAGWYVPFPIRLLLSFWSKYR